MLATYIRNKMLMIFMETLIHKMIAVVLPVGIQTAALLVTLYPPNGLPLIMYKLALPTQRTQKQPMARVPLVLKWCSKHTSLTQISTRIGIQTEFKEQVSRVHQVPYRQEGFSYKLIQTIWWSNQDQNWSQRILRSGPPNWKAFSFYRANAHCLFWRQQR